MRNRDRLESGSLRILQGEVPEAADAEHGDPLVRLGLGPAQAAPHRIARAKERRGLLVRNIVWNQESTIGIHEHVLRMTALQIHPSAFLIGAEIPASALAPFAAPTGGLNPGGAHAIAYFSGGNVRGHGHNLADRFMTQDSGNSPGMCPKVSCTSV